MTRRLFHSLAAFAFHHTRLDVAVLEPNRLTVCENIARALFWARTAIKFAPIIRLNREERVQIGRAY
ncbi:hypothetical protein T4D_7018 [Trichinella pseudospiralis]|uniref:Uncharacterized protein n=1 Tax=Trichinella pseudospiralis TaxID=6337 RepID=A0A0V1FZU1_TRIPS|nr:hypothetical protein T4D_7018 [Trichinella pseudospiralis]